VVHPKWKFTCLSWKTRGTEEESSLPNKPYADLHRELAEAQMQIFAQEHVPGSHNRHFAVVGLCAQRELRLFLGTNAPAVPAAEEIAAFS